MQFAAPQRFIRRHHLRGPQHSLDDGTPPLQRQRAHNRHERNVRTTVVERSYRPVDSSDGLRAQYNRLVGRSIEQEYGSSRNLSRSDSWGTEDLEWIFSFDRVQEFDNVVRLQVLPEDFEPPDADFLELPDQNDF